MSSIKRQLGQTSPESEQNQLSKRVNIITMNGANNQSGNNLPGVPTANIHGNNAEINNSYHQQLPQQQQFLTCQNQPAAQQHVVLPTNDVYIQNQNASSSNPPPNPAVLPSDFWSNLSQILDTKLETVAKKDDLNMIYAEIERLRDENQDLRNELQLMKNRMELMEHTYKQGNLVVSGLAATLQNQAKEEFVQLCKTVLKCDVNVTSVRKIANGKSFDFGLNATLEAENVMSSRRFLRGSNVFIQRDTTVEERSKMFNLRVLEKNIRKVDTNIKIRQGFARIFVADKPFYWLDGKYAPTNQTDADFLRNLVLRANFDVQVMVKPRTPRRPTSSHQATTSSTNTV